jgi:hypothetical protein
MSEIKKWLTPKRFIALGSKLSATSAVVGFLDKHRAFLQGYEIVSPILQAYDNKELPPTITLQTIQSALMDHVLQSEIKSAKDKMEAQAEAAEVPNAEYEIKLYCKFIDRAGNLTIKLGEVEKITGYRIHLPGVGVRTVNTKEETEGYIAERLIEIVPAVWEANDYGAAQRLADRRLFQREDSVYATITNTQGKPITTVIQRLDSIARILRQPKQPFSRKTGGSSSSLKWRGRARQTRDVWHLRK